MAPTRSRYFINRYRRIGNPLLRRTDSSPDYLETIIIHSDSSDEERRLDQEIDDIRERMDELDEQKTKLRRQMALKFKERENIRVARRVKKNNQRLRQELESRLLPTIESIASRRQAIADGVRELFENIDNHPEELPPSYRSLFPNENTTRDGNDSDGSTSSTTSLPSVSSIFREIASNNNSNSNNNNN